jgi:hypothetical protein
VRLVCDLLFSEVVLMASTEELSRLAGAVADGEGLLSSMASPGGNDLAGVQVRKAFGPGVPIRLDPERQLLVISGDSAGRAALDQRKRCAQALVVARPLADTETCLTSAGSRTEASGPRNESRAWPAPPPGKRPRSR